MPRFHRTKDHSKETRGAQPQRPSRVRSIRPVELGLSTPVGEGPPTNSRTKTPEDEVEVDKRADDRLARAGVIRTRRDGALGASHGAGDSCLRSRASLENAAEEKTRTEYRSATTRTMSLLKTQIWTQAVGGERVGVTLAVAVAVAVLVLVLVLVAVVVLVLVLVLAAGSTTVVVLPAHKSPYPPSGNIDEFLRRLRI